MFITTDRWIVKNNKTGEEINFGKNAKVAAGVAIYYGLSLYKVVVEHYPTYRKERKCHENPRPILPAEEVAMLDSMRHERIKSSVVTV